MLKFIDVYTSLCYAFLKAQFRVGHSTIRLIVAETCKAIIKVLHGDYMQFPNKKETWEKIAEDFKTIWNMPNCIGALDGKHIAIPAVPNSGSTFF